MDIIKINLHLFATQTTGTSSLSSEMKTYYNMELLDDAEPNLVHEQFGQKRPIPKGGGKTIEWRKFSSLGKATTPLTEGVTPAGNALTVSAITATINQYGDYIVQSDLLELTAIDNTILEATKLLGNQAGITLDTIVRNELVGGTNVIYAPKIVSGAPTAITSRANLDATAKLTPDLVRQAVRQLRRMNVPTINGDYVCIIHPDVSYDLMSNAEWQDMHKYAAPENLYNGEIGKIGGVRFVESSEAKIWKGDGCPSGLAVYGCLFLGADAYGVTELTGGGLEHIVKQKGSSGSADPLDQRSSIGWKATRVAKRLAEERIVRVECCSSYSATATAN